MSTEEPLFWVERSATVHSFMFLVNQFHYTLFRYHIAYRVMDCSQDQNENINQHGRVTAN